MYIAALVALGLFWGLSPSLYKLMGEMGIPISHIVVFTGIGVGLGLLATIGRKVYLTRPLVLYGLGCGILLNIPFALSLEFPRHMPATDFALIISTFPLFNYMVSLVIGRERLTLTRSLAMAAGFVASAILILGNDADGSSRLTWWTVGAFSVPFLYTFYNYFCSTRWPAGADIRTVGMAESFASALTALPFLLILEPVGGRDQPPILNYWPLLIAIAIWIVERIAYFTLIRDKGPVFTGQAVFIATPAGVIWGILIFGDQATVWLWASLALLMVALWLNTQREGVRKS
jgi:drug/metabolite transporter (DMT)-like permease